MQQRGKLVIFAMFFLASVLGGYAWWHHYSSNPICRKFWGSEALVVLNNAPKVEILMLRPAVAPPSGAPPSGAPPSGAPPSGAPPSGAPVRGDSVTIDGQSFEVVQRTDISRAPGLIHARHALVVDGNFDWQRQGSPRDFPWEFALRLTDGPDHVTVAFDTDGGGVWWVEGERDMQLVPRMAAAFRKKRDEWQPATKRP